MPSGTSNRSGVHQREVEQFRSGEPGSPPLDADETTSIDLEIIAAAIRTSFERARDRIASISGALKRVSAWSAGLGGIVSGVDMQACARLPIECLEYASVQAPPCLADCADAEEDVVIGDWARREGR